MFKLKKKIILIIQKIIRFISTESKKTYKNNLPDLLDKYTTEDTFNFFKDSFRKSVLFKNVWEIRKYAIHEALFNDKNLEFYYLEFGTFNGITANMFSKYVKKLYTFDSFKGLGEDWKGRFNRPRGYFNLDGKLPKLNHNVEPVIGWVQDTLDDFLNTHKPKINFVHFDMDTYSPTKFTLSKIKPYLSKNAILIFDDFYNYYGWRQGEYKALTETFDESEYEFKAFDLSSKGCVILIK